MQRVIFGLCVALLGASLAWAAQPPGKGKDKAQNYAKAPPALGTDAPPFALADLDGKRFELKAVLGKRPVVIEFGSYT